MSMLFSLSLFFLSFAPLWLTIILMDLKSLFENSSNLWVENITILCLVYLSLLCLGSLCTGFDYRTKEGTTYHTLQKVKEEKKITSSYLLSYILPLLTFDFKTWSGVLYFLIFFVTLCFLCIKHNNFSINIVLEMLGYKYYVCTLENDDGVMVKYHVISKRYLSAYIGENIYLKSINNEYKLDVE